MVLPNDAPRAEYPKHLFAKYADQDVESKKGRLSSPGPWMELLFKVAPTMVLGVHLISISVNAVQRQDPWEGANAVLNVVLSAIAWIAIVASIVVVLMYRWSRWRLRFALSMLIFVGTTRVLIRLEAPLAAEGTWVRVAGGAALIGLLSMFVPAAARLARLHWFDLARDPLEARVARLRSASRCVLAASTVLIAASFNVEWAEACRADNDSSLALHIRDLAFLRDCLDVEALLLGIGLSGFTGAALIWLQTVVSWRSAPMPLIEQDENEGPQIDLSKIANRLERHASMTRWRALLSHTERRRELRNLADELTTHNSRPRLSPLDTESLARSGHGSTSAPSEGEFT